MATVRRAHAIRDRLLILLASMVTASLVQVPRANADTVLRTPRAPAYEVQLRSDAEGHLWSGTETISFRNGGDAPLAAVWLRLWDNGILGCAGGADPIQVADVQGGVPGHLETDCTALRIVLSTPVAPGAEGSVSMGVRIEVPARNERFGYRGGLAFIGNALPVLAVRDDHGWHHTEPYSSIGESFYSVAGRFRVTLDTPASLDTPTSGVRVARTLLAGRAGAFHVRGGAGA